MLKSILLLACAAAFLGAALAAQQGVPASHVPNPVNNPEPLTLLALAGGALAAGGLAYRKRKRDE